MHVSVQRTSSWQSSASGASSRSGGGSSRTGPVPKPRFTVGGQAVGDEVDLAPSRRPGRDARRRPVPEALVRKAEGRSQSSPGDRVKPPPQAPPAPPPPHHAKAATPSRNGVVSGRDGTPRSYQQHVDRSLGNVDSPLSAFVDRTGLVFDVRSKTAYRRGRLLGKVQLNYTLLARTASRCRRGFVLPLLFFLLSVFLLIYLHIFFFRRLSLRLLKGSQPNLDTYSLMTAI